jgi:hypothetical protein
MSAAYLIGDRDTLEAAGQARRLVLLHPLRQLAVGDVGEEQPGEVPRPRAWMADKGVLVES